MVKYTDMKNDPLKKNNSEHGVAIKATVMSMALNILLAAGKIVCGVAFGSVSIATDGFNNLSDCGGNVISLIGVKISAMPADKEHPFGHARGEYVASMALSFLILLMGFELFSLSVEKIIERDAAIFSVISVVVLAVSIAVKLFMFFFNRRLGKKLSSDVLSATAIDSLGDALASTVVLVSMLVMRFCSVGIDGYAGCLVAVVIFVSGIKVLKNAVDEELGKRPTSAVVDEIKRRLLSYEGVYGVHALTVHDYVNKLYAAVHIEIDADVPFLAAHELADKIEKDFTESTDVVLTVHLDPIVTSDPLTLKLRSIVEGMLESYPFVIHDFRIVRCNPMRLIFEVGVPQATAMSDDEIKKAVFDKLYDEFGLKYDYFVSVERETSM